MPKATAAHEPEIRATLEALVATPEQIARIARGHSEAILHHSPAPDAWSAREIVAHLRACAEVWGRSIDRMIAEHEPTIRYVSPRGWLKKTDYLNQNFAESLRDFAGVRRGLLDTLVGLDVAGWSRRATFTGTTLGREATVLSYAKRIAEHEVQHLEQLRRVLER
ncbi:MAG: DinB family protein [Candidatus Eisenbacteria bacterium]|nr:DinB family protein [Candidatus Eisenbacteria bacterium]